ncbi:MAG: tRNA (adenosine(37)-N6)-threonylcarbamoyltransferase complex dimerization subunit type 1 TsaB [Acidisphaera sp.]|nr:tRNA (adenosine(37)-N6)-threonylcarbamoyltransferase complex dimerization subunit type 1 TsaB [Acidisphaera sp.]
MRILALDAALARCSAGLVEDRVLLAARQAEAARGHAALLPALARQVMEEAGRRIDLVAVTVGPGGFTGLRAALSLAHGVALGAGVPVIGVSVGEALADALPHLGVRALWVAIDSRRGRVFLECEGTVRAWAAGSLPEPSGPVAVAGDAAAPVAAALAARGSDVMLTDARLPLPRHVALVAERRHLGALPARAAQPMYVDPPEVRMPADPPRPAPRE